MADPELSGQARELTELLSDLAECGAAEDEERICCYDVSVSECRALQVLRDETAPAMQRLAGRLGVTKSGATRIVDRLERKGYARRERDAADGRVCCVTATSEGTALLRRIEGERIAHGQAIMEEIEPSSRVRVLESLRLLRRATSRASTSAGEEVCC